MPPKGWRKDAQGNYPTTSYIKEQEHITIQDLLFPKSVVMQLAKEANVDATRKVLINKDVSLALQRSATVFVNHLLMFAREFAKNQDRKSCNINDIYDSLDQIGFGGFKTLINNKMIQYQEALELKKQFKETRSGEGVQGETDDHIRGEDDDDDDDDDDTENEEGDDEGPNENKDEESVAKKQKPSGSNDES